MEKIQKITDAEGVIKFLIKQPKEDAKYIFNDHYGIKYVDTETYGNLVNRYNVPLDDILDDYISLNFVFDDFDDIGIPQKSRSKILSLFRK